MTVPQRLAALRAAMTAQGWAAYLITGTDPHDSEYLPARWETRAWISGFTGSAGTVVVTADQAGLWTDGRYFLQAETQLAGSGITLFREGLPSTPSPVAWLTRALPRGAVASVDARSVPWSKLVKWRAETAVAGVTIDAGPDLLDTIWTDRPAAPANPVWDYETPAITPRSAKLAALRQTLRAAGADACLVTTLDDLAWLFNLRGSDIAYTPQFLGWGWVDDKTAAVYLGPEAGDALKDVGVEIRPYERFEADVKAAQKRLLVSADRVNAHLITLLNDAGVPWTDGSPITAMKAKKSAGELELVRQAHRKDGVALVEFLATFDALATSGTWTETAAARALDAQRERRGGYHGPSFTAIPGFRENGAIIHYHAEGEGARIEGRGLFLLDTGAQYLEGTTDVTRTLAIGTPTADEIEDYTLVLKAHVQVSLMPFPVGTRGYMIDAFARRALWKTGRNYGHGTGHGVGHFLSVHEGPARLNSEPIPVALEPGMILSNEPGLYRTGRYGIRIENLVTVIPGETTEFAAFLKWETLTLCPYDRRLIDTALLDADERRWIDVYHAWVAAELGPLVSPEARTWLDAACRPL